MLKNLKGKYLLQQDYSKTKTKKEKLPNGSRYQKTQLWYKNSNLDELKYVVIFSMIKIIYHIKPHNNVVTC